MRQGVSHREVTMKARMNNVALKARVYRVAFALASLAAVVEVFGAGRKF
jgi:hypothetical protein